MKVEVLDFIDNIQESKLAKCKVLNDYSHLSNSDFIVRHTNNSIVVWKADSDEKFYFDSDLVFKFYTSPTIDDSSLYFLPSNFIMGVLNVDKGNNFSYYKAHGYDFIYNATDSVVVASKDNVYCRTFHLGICNLYEIREDGNLIIFNTFIAHKISRTFKFNTDLLEV